MKKVLLFLALMTITTMPIDAQNNAESGIMLINEVSETALSEAQLRKCENLMKDAQWYIKRKEFGKAKSKLTELLAINPKDQQAKVLLDQCKDFTTEYGESAAQRPTKFTLGAVIGADFFEKNYGIHFGLTARYGGPLDLINVTGGLELAIQQSYHGRADVLEGYTRALTLGGQIVIPVAVQFNLVEVKKGMHFYVGPGAEFGLKLYAKDIESQGWTGTRNYQLMNNTTISGLIKAGIAGRHLDAGIYYKHYLTDLVNKNFPSYQENSRIGFAVAYYF